MILCKSCDAEIQPGQTFCVNCGARTEGNTYSTSDSTSAPVPGGFSTAPGTPVAPAVPVAPSIPATPPAYLPTNTYSPPVVPTTDTQGYQPTSYPTTPANSTLAVVSLVFGLLGWTALPLIGSIVAIVTGHLGRREIRDSNGQLSGDGMAIAGMALGYAAVVLFVIACGLIGLFVVIGAAAS